MSSGHGVEEDLIVLVVRKRRLPRGATIHNGLTAAGNWILSGRDMQ